jgi:hypothetical protein
MARLTWRLSNEQLIRRLRFEQRWWRSFWTATLIVGLLLLAASSKVSETASPSASVLSSDWC